MSRRRATWCCCAARRIWPAPRAGLKLLAELGVDFHLVDAARAREIEPGLHPGAPLHAAVHLPSDEVGNCRQFAQAMRAEAQRLGAVFQFQRAVRAVAPGAAPTVQHQAAGGGGDAVQNDSFDAVVVCAALGRPRCCARWGCGFRCWRCTATR